MWDKIKAKVISFLHGESVGIGVKAALAYLASPAFSEALQKLNVNPDGANHQLAWNVILMWGLDRVHRLYKENKVQ